MGEPQHWLRLSDKALREFAREILNNVFERLPPRSVSLREAGCPVCGTADLGPHSACLGVGLSKCSKLLQHSGPEPFEMKPMAMSTACLNLALNICIAPLLMLLSISEFFFPETVKNVKDFIVVSNLGNVWSSESK